MILMLGSSGAAVTALSNDLRQIGFESERHSGDRFGRALQAAVKRFQSSHVGPDGRPLAIDGIVGPLTWFAIDVALGRRAAAQPPAPSVPIPEERPARSSEAGWNALQVARAELARGAGEVGGNNAGPHVRRYHAVTGAPEGASWCASFVAYCFAEGNPGPVVYPPTASARETLNRFRKNGWAVAPREDDPPRPGDVIVWWRGSVRGWQGHIGLVAGHADGIVHTIEGNRTAKVAAFQYTLGRIERLLGFGRARP